MQVSEKALYKRIDRALLKNGYRLRKTRALARDWALGQYYVVDDQNCLIDADVFLEDYGRELGVLKESDELIGN